MHIHLVSEFGREDEVKQLSHLDNQNPIVSYHPASPIEFSKCSLKLNQEQYFQIKSHLIDHWGLAWCSKFPGETCQFVVIAANAHVQNDVTGFVHWQKSGAIPMIEAKSVPQGGDVLFWK